MTMHRSSSEWAFQRFLQEASMSHVQSPPPPPIEVGRLPDDSNHHGEDDGSEIDGRTPPLHAHPPSDPSPDHEDYHREILKQRLDLACAAVAKSRVAGVKPQDVSAALADTGSQSSDTQQLGPQAPGKQHTLDNRP
ncbi:hypothetical protein ACLOJK_026946, partial [Asimina triloba]